MEWEKASDVEGMGSGDKEVIQRWRQILRPRKEEI